MRYQSGFAILALGLSLSTHATVTISTSELFAQIVQIDRETELLMQKVGSRKHAGSQHVEMDLKPRHIWQKTYFILLKINAYRRKNGMPINTINSLEPVLHLDSTLVYEQSQRLLTELRIIKRRMGIDKQVSALEPVKDKRMIDIFNRLHEISLHFEVLNGETNTISLIFSEVMRIYEDINTILRGYNIKDTSFPPEKQIAITPKDSLEAAFDMMREIQRLQRSTGIAHTDFTALNKIDGVVPPDVFNMVGMALAELQTIKASLDLTHHITPPANFYEGKRPADVHQLLRWMIHKLKLIESL